MKLSTLLLLIILVAIAVFAALNWTVFITPTELSLGFTKVLMPLGLVMLGLLTLLTVFFLGFVVYLQTSALLETRRHTRELQASRDLADKAEASRFNELRSFLEAELLKLTNQHTQLEGNLHTAIEHSGNSIAAYIGELDDRLEKTK
ncbi:MAG: LapA family protein [Methylophilaceae bacterium]